MTGQEMTGMILRGLLVKDWENDTRLPERELTEGDQTDRHTHGQSRCHERGTGGADSSTSAGGKPGGVRLRRCGGKCFAISRRARR